MSTSYRLTLTVLLALLLSGCPMEESIREAQAPEAEPATMEAVLQQAAVAYQDEQWPEAEQLYLRATRELPSEAIPWFRLGNIYVRTNRPQQAVLAYQEALVREPKMSKAWHNLAVTHLRQGMKALEDLQAHASDDDPLVSRSEHLSQGLRQLIDEQ